jgi:hypothetical protein
MKTGDRYIALYGRCTYKFIEILEINGRYCTVRTDKYRKREWLTRNVEWRVHVNYAPDETTVTRMLLNEYENGITSLSPEII